MNIETFPESFPLASKPYHLPIRHHKFVKEEIEHLLEGGLIECSMGPYVTTAIAVPRKSKQGAPLSETKQLVMDYRELNK